MRKTIIIIGFGLLAVCVFSQNAPASLIKKCRIKEIDKYSYDGPDSNRTSYIDKCEYDVYSRLVFHQLIDKDTSEGGDTSFSGNYYFYKNNHLIESWDIGVWNIRSMKQDTTIEKYFYNSEDSLIEIRLKTTWSEFLGSKLDEEYKYDYKDGRKVRVVLKDLRSNRVIELDTFIYKKNSVIKMQIRPNSDTLINKYFYNTNNQITMFVESYSDGGDTIKYTYSGVLLVKEEKYWYRIDQKGPLNEYYGSLYFYNENGLLNEVRRLSDKVILERYKYDHY